MSAYKLGTAGKDMFILATASLKQAIQTEKSN